MLAEVSLTWTPVGVARAVRVTVVVSARRALASTNRFAFSHVRVRAFRNPKVLASALPPVNTDTIAAK